MANHIKVAMVSSILTLHRQGWSNRRIARELNVHRDTVARYIRQAESELPKEPLVDREESGEPKPGTNPILGNGEAAESKPATNPILGNEEPAEPKPATNPILGNEEPAESKPATDPILGNEETAESQPATNPILGNEETAEPKLATNPILGNEGATRSREDANSTLESQPSASSQVADLPPDLPGPASLCESFREVIERKLDEGLCGKRIWQDLVDDHGFTGSYSSVRRFLQRLGQSTVLPFRRMECDPGQEAQVDFGRGAPVQDSEGKRRHSHVFRIVLSYSRKGYSQCVWRQTTDEFIRVLENAFWAFGGVPKTIVLDNLRAAVSKPDWFDPELNPKVEAFAKHYGTVMLPTKPYMPRHKGKVESGIKYVRQNALKGHVFTSLAEQDQHLREWECHVADHRIHGTTKQQVKHQFEQVERTALLPLPRERFPFFHEAERQVHRDAHVEVDKAYYSVPPEYLGHRVWVRWDTRLVRIFNQRFESIAIHAKTARGKFSTQREHLASKKIAAVERGAEFQLKRAYTIGPQTGQWAQAMLQERGVQGVRVLVGLLAMADRYPTRQIEHACAQARAQGAFRLQALRALIREPVEQQQFDFVQTHELIRPLDEYGRRMPVCFHPPSPPAPEQAS